ncbi:hypothetical protein CDAR_580841 [Caerostris darwini]|uniref:Uncharacterized protein n=1 Tax=Caerostris darwini TaxID=1538125 RepID=A0AAV4RKP9_9ARAC|nr:hypothetical protein CDAR_580841 [Caerostris darwini]
MKPIVSKDFQLAYYTEYDDKMMNRYESVVQRVVDTDEELKRLEEKCKALLAAQEKWRLEKARLLKLIPAKKSSGLPGPSRSAMSPAKKRRAHSQDREVSGKRQRINEPLHQRAPAPSASTAAPSASTAAPSASTAAPSASTAPSACCTFCLLCCTFCLLCCTFCLLCCTFCLLCCTFCLHSSFHHCC